MNYDHHCFGCGEKNEKGLKLKFRLEDDTVRTTFIPNETHQGYPGIMHGGITSTILDEVMSQCLHTLGETGVTARLEVRFRDRIPVGNPVEFEARITEKKGRIVDTEARAFLENGKVAAEGKARFIIIERNELI